MVKIVIGVNFGELDLKYIKRSRARTLMEKRFEVNESKLLEASKLKREIKVNH